MRTKLEHLRRAVAEAEAVEVDEDFVLTTYRHDRRAAIIDGDLRWVDDLYMETRLRTDAVSRAVAEDAEAVLDENDREALLRLIDTALQEDDR